MSEAKHTPGPWLVDAVFGERDRDIILGYDIPGAGSPVLIASVYDEADDDGNPRDFPISREAGGANAQLVAAAPDLLAACKAVVACAGNPENLRGKYRETLEQCIAAIRAAEGAEGGA